MDFSDEKNLSEVLKRLSVLYIEDEENIRINVKKVLELICGNVYDAPTTEKAKIILKSENIDVIISDINLPNQNGLEFVEEIRNIDRTIPVILLSAYTDTKYLLKATKLKLIDYLTKPIDFKTLNESLLKCAKDIIENSRYIINFPNNISYNVLQKKLFNKETEISLTSKELLILDFLIKYHNRVVSHEEIKVNVWHDSFEATDSALKNLLNKLRKKIGKESITNISGVGYKIEF